MLNILNQSEIQFENCKLYTIFQFEFWKFEMQKFKTL